MALRAELRCLGQIGFVRHRIEPRERAVGDEALHQSDRLVPILRIPERDANQEPIQLRFRQWKGALRLHGILRRDDQEGRVERVGRSALGDLALLHAFEQCRLGARRGAVDLIGQQDVRKHGALDEGEFPGLLRVDLHAGDVRRKQIRRELHAGEIAAERPGQRFGQRRLARAGDVFQQHMPAGKQRGEDQFHLARFADDHSADVLAQRGRERLQVGILHGAHSIRWTFVNIIHVVERKFNPASAKMRRKPGELPEKGEEWGIDSAADLKENRYFTKKTLVKPAPLG